MDVTILDLGSHTLKAGVPYNFPADADPSVVKFLSPSCSPFLDPYWELPCT